MMKRQGPTDITGMNGGSEDYDFVAWLPTEFTIAALQGYADSRCTFDRSNRLDVFNPEQRCWEHFKSLCPKI